MRIVTDIKTIDDILYLLEHHPYFDNWSQYGHVNTKTEGDYILFNYSAEAQYAGNWNVFERMSRGLIIDKKRLKVMARPFDKFFNWNERGMSTDSPIEYVMEKMDGSLGICWFDPHFEYAGTTGNWRITTRGSFDSEQAQWATEFLHANYGHRLQVMENGFTHLFEIIYPENRIVVDYGKTADLFLLAVRDNVHGAYINYGVLIENVAKSIGCKSAKLRQDIVQGGLPILFLAISGIKGVEKEGFVTVHRDGTRWKFKGEDYVRIHKVISSFSFKHTLEAIAAGTFEQWIESIPDEFLGDIRQWEHAIRDEFKRIKLQINEKFWKVEPIKTRKLFAEAVIDNYPDIAPFLFRKLDGKLTDEFIYQKHDFSHLEQGESE